MRRSILTTRTAVLLVIMLVVLAAITGWLVFQSRPTRNVNINKQFVTLPPGSALPDGAECASRVRRSSTELREENTPANQYIPEKGTDYDLEEWTGIGAKGNALRDRVDGNFTGTTDEILQWAACKWGIDEDVVRAQAVRESTWYQSTVGDNGESFGILQVKGRVHQGTYPASEKSTAFNADFTYARWRTCYEGWIDYMTKNPAYKAGDMWGCIGAWYTGQYLNGKETEYVAAVKEELEQRDWENPRFTERKKP